MQNERMIKQLQSQLKNHNADLEALRIEIKSKNLELNNKISIIEDIESKISSLTELKEPAVTEHAILRYLERVHGLNIAELTEEILTPKIKMFAKQLGGNGRFPHAQTNLTFIMKDYRIVTIAPK